MAEALDRGFVVITTDEAGFACVTWKPSDMTTALVHDPTYNEFTPVTLVDLELFQAEDGPIAVV
jgi:hypothetical protein